MKAALWQHYGKFDFDVMMEAITFLSPDRTPGYWHAYLNASDPMSAQVEQLLCIDVCK